MPPTGTSAWNDLDELIEAYESAHSRDGDASIEEFLPPRDHDYYLVVLRELVRVEVELSWQSRSPRRIDSYRDRFPELFADPESLAAVAFEEYRQRLLAGEAADAREYSSRWGINTDDWPQPPSSPRVHQATVVRPVAPVQLPPTRGGEGAAPELGDVAVSFRDHCAASATGKAEQVEQWASRYASDDGRVELFREAHAQDPQAARRLAEALASWPQPGEEFEGYKLLSELGRGAFGRVFLAEQPNLARRKVALKVAPDLTGESWTLARLQHTHIVPVYSVHPRYPFMALCMPYYGGCTLSDVQRHAGRLPEPPLSGADLLAPLRAKPPASGEAAGKGLDTLRKLEGMNYVEACLWVVARLADGLGHAHERGILHRDLKPANVLLSDEGQPMLLDFNLAEDTTVLNSPAAARVGGTLPYMAPEHLAAFQRNAAAPDRRADVYSLGVILYELVARRHPYPLPPGFALHALVPRMIEDRRRPLVVDGLHPQATPAVGAILAKALHPDPARRYQTARELQEDIERQLANHPLRHARERSVSERVTKWRRRHPRLLSFTSLAIASVVAVAALGGAVFWSHERLEDRRARDVLTAFEEDSNGAFNLLYVRQGDANALDPGLEKARQGLGRYAILDRPVTPVEQLAPRLSPKDLEKLRGELVEVLLYSAQANKLKAEKARDSKEKEALLNEALALNDRAGGYSGGSPPQALLLQRAELLEALSPGPRAEEARRQASERPLETYSDYYWSGTQLVGQGRLREAITRFEGAVRKDPSRFRAYFALAQAHAWLGDYDKATHHYTTAIALWPHFGPAYHNRARAYLQLRDYERAAQDLDEVLRLDPDQTTAYIDRALARRNLKGQEADAVADLNRALERGNKEPRLYFLRADLLRAQGGKEKEALEDLRAGLKATPADDVNWVARGQRWLNVPPDLALARGAALGWPGWRAQRAAQALADYDAALEYNPRCQSALQNKAHAQAEVLGRNADARRTLDHLLRLYPDSVLARSGRGVVLARLGERNLALEDARAVSRPDAPPDIVYQVGCIYALTSAQAPQDRDVALGCISDALRRGFGHDLLPWDPDLNPLRGQPGFRQLEDASRALRPGRTPPPR